MKKNIKRLVQHLTDTVPCLEMANELLLPYEDVEGIKEERAAILRALMTMCSTGIAPLTEQYNRAGQAPARPDPDYTHKIKKTKCSFRKK